MPSRTDVAGIKMYDPFIMNGLRLASMTLQPADNFPISTSHPTVLLLDPNGAAKDVLLPAEADSKNLVFIIRNIAAGAFAIVVKEDSDTTTIISLAQGKSAMVHCDGTTWRTITQLA